MKRLILVRHGESEWNQQRRVQGQSGTGLTDVGRRQAELTARWLAETHPDAVLVASDLERCRQTIAPLAAQLHRPVELDPELRERSFGRWEGKLLSEIEAEDRELWDRWRQGEDVVSEVGGESGDELAARAHKAFLRHVEQVDDGGVVVAVTHGGPIWHGLTSLLGLPFGTFGGVANTAITEVGVDGDNAWLEAWNVTAHLPAALRTWFRPSDRKRQAPATGR